MTDKITEKILTPKNDVIFKRLFGKKGNENIVKDFLEAVLDIKIESVTLGKETELLPEKIDEKLGILDVRVTLADGTEVDVEMQNVNMGDITKRMTYYLNRLYLSGIEKGKTYLELNKVIAIGILNFNYFKDINEYHTVWKMTERNNKDKTLDEQEIHIIELPKFLKSKLNIERKLDQWLLFIDNTRKELIQMAEEKNENVKEAAEEYEYLTGDEDVQRMAFLRRKYELDYNSGMEYAKREGLEEGKKEGIEEGRKEGIEEGMKKGEEEGRKQEKIEIVKRMLYMNVSTAIITEVTGLSYQEIDSIIESINKENE